MNSLRDRFDGWPASFWMVAIASSSYLFRISNRPGGIFELGPIAAFDRAAAHSGIFFVFSGIKTIFGELK
jgi:hypothetical protein